MLLDLMMIILSTARLHFLYPRLCVHAIDYYGLNCIQILDRFLLVVVNSIFTVTFLCKVTI